MAKTITALLLVLLLAGCASGPVKLRTETVEVFKPILYCPAPNWDGLDRPNPLAIEEINPSMSAGEVVKRYKASIKQLQDYADRLEKSLQKYDSTNQAYEELRKQFLEQRARDGFPGEEVELD